MSSCQKSLWRNLERARVRIPGGELSVHQQFFLLWTDRKRNWVNQIWGGKTRTGFQMSDGFIWGVCKPTLNTLDFPLSTVHLMTCDMIEMILDLVQLLANKSCEAPDIKGYRRSQCLLHICIVMFGASFHSEPRKHIIKRPQVWKSLLEFKVTDLQTVLMVEKQKNPIVRQKA